MVEINWKDAWEEMQKQRMRPLKIGYDPEFKSKFARDYAMMAKYNNYEYGRKAVEALSEILDRNFSVLEIGAGPGTLTIPLAKHVKNIVAVEASPKAVELLKQNIKENELENVEIITDNWFNINDDEIKDKFDLVICSHFLWQVKDIEQHLKKMENASHNYCVVMQPAGRDDIVKEMWTMITGRNYMGEFDPDADYFVYLILRRLGRLLNVRVMDYHITRNFEQEVMYIASFIGRYVEVDSGIKQRIEQHVSKKGCMKKSIRQW